ncbi:leucine-rich PPR motif-containing protein, mitochondrial [Ischnura elegans]|uniref:leucine-rich PPR motif-containing protein, mitochondrial n=1 Tax=Ischnura elegans TaxID=197161 RepID=UPI001ED8A1B5|nr:leucine-rich PPR motif-containing protein, mitochondrial [Ischnura elegans]XP_046388704.1 leucine-rich PPR motif-containing protein, mitochondrial [Ischnura elegans]
MSSILRTSKFIKLFAGISRNVTGSSLRRGILTKAECDQKFNNVFRALATQRVESRKQNENSFERNLRRLDMDVRRSGRISRKDLEEVIEEMKRSTSATSSQSLLLIRCCGNLVPEERPEVRTKLVQEIWKTIEQLGIPMDISHYNALLRVYLENKHEFSPAEFLAELEKKGVEPNRVTFQRLIAHYCQKGDIDGATRILQHMKEKQLPVNEGVFNSLIMGHANSGDMESAKGMLGVMEQAGLPPSAETYATLLCGFAKMGDKESISNTLKDCDAKQIDIIDRDYMDILYVAVANNHPELADELLGRMRRVAGYNQDAVNLILKLVNDGNEDVAYKILLTMPRPVRTDGEEIPIGNFFIKHLVKSERPKEKILYFCEELEKNSLNPKAHLIALEACLTMTQDRGQAFSLMEALMKKGYPPRVHFYWPLLASLGQKGDINGMGEVIMKMMEMKLVPGAETLRDYVIPYLMDALKKDGKGFNADSIISTLRGWGVSLASSANGLVGVLITKMKLKDAVDVAKRYRSRYAPVALMRPLNIALDSTKDYDSYAAILSHVVNGLGRSRTFANQDEDGEEIDVEVAQVPENAGEDDGLPRKVVGSFLLDLCFSSRQTRSETLLSLLPALQNYGLGISKSHAEMIQERLGNEITPEISTLLGKLTSEELTPINLSAEQDFRPQAMEVKDLENLLMVQQSKGSPTRGLKRQLLVAYCRSRNVEGAKKILQELEADKDFVFNEGTYALVLELFAISGMPDDALMYHQRLLEVFPGTAIEDFKLIKLVECLVKANRLEDALKVISEQPSDRKMESRSFGYNSASWRILNHLAEAGNVEELDKLFDALLQKNFIEPTNILMGPLVNVHLLRNDIEGALKKFEWCCEKYGGTPFKNQLACKLIEAEDAVSLQRITDISTRVHGEVNSLYDLVFAFIECGRLKQARRILETPGLRSRPSRLSAACRRYLEEGMVAPLEGLVEATKDLLHIDRAEIYLHLLNLHSKSNDAEKAMGLWMQMQDEDVQPSDEFLKSLANLLRKNNMKVPFVEPKAESTLSVRGKAISPAKEPELQKPEAGSTPKSPLLQRFRQAIRIGDADAALQCKAKIEAEGKKMPVTELSLLVEQLVKNDRIGEATAITENYLSPEIRQGGRLISPRVLRFLLNRLANLGDVDSITNIGNLISREEKRLLSFDNRLCNAFVVSGKAEEYLKNLEKQIEVAKDEDLDFIEEAFPRGGAFGVLNNHPELVPMYEGIAKKYAARKIISPLNVLWASYFLNEAKATEANTLWKDYLHDYPRVMFQFVCQTARVNKDISILDRLLDQIKDSPVSDGARGSVYSTKIGVHVANENYEEGLIALNEALKDVSLVNINRRVLFKLKNEVEKTGKSFPHTIPKQKASSSSSSSSSSDDEPEKEKKQ